ncbi:RimJ/RimL family protein N-acetyltransferase [Virgibacillus phasianinus]|uniref:RimJ/RimL family protein N-acetyltransferase n=1 Tax=Virgibacillus phasianinus TaxID=2017483 RepID=A0A220U1K9_9BACI|nr:GNAT family protein [Virgibacillus phasianinus]ASK61816.1 RimJ/RimL family protein N-acetyltransferase [Virgibacillus phasianinus]
MFFREIDEDLTLKLMQIDDAEELFNLTDASRSYLREWLPWVDTTTTIDDSRGFIEHTMQGFQDKKSMTVAVHYKGKMVGTASFNSLDWSNKVAYIGYWLGQDYQGNGIITRVVRYLTDYAFTELAFNRVDIRAAFENKKSRSIPKRLGFIEEGQIRQAEWIYDHYVDHVVYGMLADEWNNQN